MENFIEDPNPFCIQIVEGYIIQTTSSDSEFCLAPDQFGNYSKYSNYIIQTQIKYRIYVNSK